MASRLPFVALLGVTACSGDGPTAAPACRAETSAVTRERQEIFYGGPDSAYLALDPREQAAVVSIVAADATSTLCSGTLVAPGWLLSAKHCIEIANPIVIVQSPSATLEVGIASSRVHPTVDVALFELEEAIDAALVVPIRVEAMSDPAPWLGRLVEIAGFGSTESMTSHERRFAVEEVVEATPETLVVDGKGRSGACLGDSGGPLLTRASDGSVRVAGVLTSGARNCLGRDAYARLDGIADWVGEATGVLDGDAPCGGVSLEGTCLYGRAVWCESGSLRAAACSEEVPCGFDVARGGYRCVLPEGDACSGVDAAGSCDGAVARRCESGMLVSERCDRCEESCSRSPRTGRVECSALGMDGAP